MPLTALHGFFFLSFFSMYSDNFDSVTNNLRNSANGTFVTSDDIFPLTVNLIFEELGGFRRGKDSAALFHNANQDVSGSARR